MGTLTIMNETISSSLQNILTEQNKIDRITGLELAAASADLALSLLQKSCDKSTLSEEERLVSDFVTIALLFVYKHKSDKMVLTQ